MSVAVAWASGLIEIADGGRAPEGAVVILRSRMSPEKLEAKVSVKARHGHEPGVLLVPGVPEALTQEEGMTALIKWRDWAFPKRIRRQAVSQ